MGDLLASDTATADLWRLPDAELLALLRLSKTT